MAAGGGGYPNKRETKKKINELIFMLCLVLQVLQEYVYEKIIRCMFVKRQFLLLLDFFLVSFVCPTHTNRRTETFFSAEQFCNLRA